MKKIVAFAAAAMLAVAALLGAGCGNRSIMNEVAQRAAETASQYYTLTLGFAGDICFADDIYCSMQRLANLGSENIADFVIALPHWGTEHSTILEPGQPESAHAYIDAGADAVIGAHPHILQGIEFYNGKPILYSLGNFWFDGYDIDTLVAELRLVGNAGEGPRSLDDARLEVVLHPGTQSEMFTAVADTPEWRDRIFRHIEAISSGIAIDDAGVVCPAG